MSNNSKNTRILGYTATIILSYLTLVYGNAEIKAFGGFILGSMFTYFVQIRLQEADRKSGIRRQNIEQTFIPLSLRFEEINQELSDPIFEENVINYDPDKEIISRILGNKQRFILKAELREQLSNFKTKLIKYEGDLRETRHLVSDILNIRFNEEILASGEFMDGVICRIRVSAQWRYPDYEIINNYRGYYRKTPLDKPITLGMNPIELTLQKYSGSAESDLFLQLEPMTQENVKKDTVRIEYPLVADAFDNYLDGVFGVINSFDEVTKVRRVNAELIEESSAILDRLGKYIKKHYPVENSV